MRDWIVCKIALRSAHLTILFSADIRETEIKLSSIFFCRFALKRLLQDIIILMVRLKLKGGGISTLLDRNLPYLPHFLIDWRDFLAWWLVFSRSTPIFSKIEDWRSFEVTWPRNWRSFQNVLTYTNGVSFPRFFGVENPNLGSNWWLEVNWGHWRRPMTSIDLQNGGHFRIQPLTHVGCLFLGFLGWRIRIWGRIDA